MRPIRAVFSVQSRRWIHQHADEVPAARLPRISLSYPFLHRQNALFGSRHRASSAFGESSLSVLPTLHVPLGPAPHRAGGALSFPLYPLMTCGALHAQVKEGVAGFGGLQNARGERWAPHAFVSDVLTSPEGMYVALAEGALRVEMPSPQDALKPLEDRLARVQGEVAALQVIKDRCDAKVNRTAKVLGLAGLTFLSAQWSFMLRLTYYEYSWDYTEPIFSFTTAGVGIIGYIFYTLTQRDYSYEALNQITVSRRQRLLYEKARLDIERYAELKRAAAELEAQIGLVRALDFTGEREGAVADSA